MLVNKDHEANRERFSRMESSQARHTTKFEFGKYSTFDDTPKNLVVTSDKESGTIVLWHQDSYTS